MKKGKYIMSLFAAAALLVGCGESLEDTYSDFAGNGKIRYVAKCSDVSVTPGWERLIVNWVNGSDIMIENIKVVWACEDLKDSILLPRTTTSFELDKLTDGNYRFDICAVDAAGNESLKEITYGRPYTRDHEIMRSFARGIVKSYFLKNKMIFFSDQWNENIIEIKLTYKDTQGNPQEYVFDKETDYQALVTLDNVSMNPADTVYVHRRGRLEGSPDEVKFDPLVVNRKKNFSAGFVNAIERRYGYSTETKEQEAEFEAFVESVEELEFDYDVETFEDVLYCPNLKKLVFGKNRYLTKTGTSYDKSKILSDPQKSIQILNKASEADILNLKIDYYGNQSNLHYVNSKLPYMTYMGYPVLPNMELVKKEELQEDDEGNRILCIPSDPYAELDNLLDNDPGSRWSTTSYPTMRTYELQMGLVEETEIRGIKLAQITYVPNSEKSAPYFMPATIDIQTSRDGAVWENVTYFKSNELGRGSGEVTLLKFHEGTRRVRYIKFSLHDGVDQGSFWMIKLGDIIPYK